MKLPHNRLQKPLGLLPLWGFLAWRNGEGQSRGRRGRRCKVVDDCQSNVDCGLPFLFSTSYKYYLRMKAIAPASGNQKPSPQPRKDSKLFIFQYRPSADKTSLNGQIPLSQPASSLASSKSTSILSSRWRKTTDHDSHKFEQVAMDHRRNLQRLQSMMKRIVTVPKEEGETGCERVFRWLLQLHQKREKELYRLGFGIIKQRFHTAHQDSGQISCSRTATFKIMHDRKSIWSSRQEQEKQILRGSKTFQIDEELLPLVDGSQKHSSGRKRKERPGSVGEPFDFHQITPKKPTKDVYILRKKQQPQITPRNRSKQQSDAQGRSSESADVKASQLVRFKKKMLKNKGKSIEEMVTPIKMTESKLEITQQARQSIIVDAGFKEERWLVEATQRKSRMTEPPEDTYKMARNCLRDQPRLTKRQSKREEEQMREERKEEKERAERLAQLAKIIHERRMKRSRSLTPSSLKAIDLSRRTDPVTQPIVKPIGRKSIETKKRCSTIPKISLSLKSKFQKPEQSPQKSPTSSILQSQILHIIKPQYEEKPSKTGSKMSSNGFIRIQEASEVENSYYADNHHRNTERLPAGSSISHKLDCIIRKSHHLH